MIMAWYCRGCRKVVPESQVSQAFMGDQDRHTRSRGGCGFLAVEQPDDAPVSQPVAEDLNQRFVSVMGKELEKCRAENEALKAELARLRKDD